MFCKDNCFKIWIIIRGANFTRVSVPKSPYKIIRPDVISRKGSRPSGGGFLAEPLDIICPYIQREWNASIFPLTTEITKYEDVIGNCLAMKPPLKLRCWLFYALSMITSGDLFFPESVYLALASVWNNLSRHIFDCFNWGWNNEKSDPERACDWSAIELCLLSQIPKSYPWVILIVTIRRLCFFSLGILEHRNILTSTRFCIWFLDNLIQVTSTHAPQVAWYVSCPLQPCILIGTVQPAYLYATLGIVPITPANWLLKYSS